MKRLGKLFIKICFPDSDKSKWYLEQKETQESRVPTPMSNAGTTTNYVTVPPLQPIQPVNVGLPYTWATPMRRNGTSSPSGGYRVSRGMMQYINPNIAP
jgi:hypothetical protein